MLSLVPELLVDDIVKTVIWYQNTLGFTVLTDIRALWDKVSLTGSTSTPLHQTDYGTWEFILQDCNGYHLIFGQSQ